MCCYFMYFNSPTGYREILKTHSESFCPEVHHHTYFVNLFFIPSISSFYLQIAGKWDSGLPYMDLKIKASRVSWETGIQLPLTMVNVSKLQVGRWGTAPRISVSEHLGLSWISHTHRVMGGIRTLALVIFPYIVTWM